LEELDRAPVPERPKRVLVGLLGREIQLSRSPQMHEDEARAQGIELKYELFDFAALGKTEADLPGFIEELQRAGFAGVNVTHPYKQAVIPLLDELSDGARKIGAVNTIAFGSGTRFGYNTDVTGFAESFRRGLPEAGLARILQTGAGGAGAATAHAMLELGAGHICLVDPDADRAGQLCEALRASYGQGRASTAASVERELASASGIINASPIGMAEYPGSPIPGDALRSHQWVADIVYFPLETELVRGARAQGCRVLDGGGMAVFQAAGAFEIFTGLRADGDRMRARFLECVGAPADRPFKRDAGSSRGT
jgi:shikimate dehydrogenase